MNNTTEMHTPLPQGSVATSVNISGHFLVLGLMLASLGQVFLIPIGPYNIIDTVMQVLAGVMLIAGGLLFGASTLHYKLESPRLELSTQSQTASRFIWRAPWSRFWLWIAIDLAFAAIYIFATRGESPFVVHLWLVSIFILFVSQFRSWSFAWFRVDHKQRLYLVGLALVLIIALVTRVYHLTTLPYNLDGDFADVGLQARALAIGQQQQIFTFGWADIPILGYLPAWLSMKLFGTGLAGLNASGVIEGLLMIVGVYLLGRDLFQARVGLFAAALLTVSYTHLAASRQSVYIDPVVFMLFAIYFLLLGLRENRGWAVVASGVLSAFCLLLYYSGRLVFPIIAVLLFFLLISYRTWLWTHRTLVFVWALAVLVTLGPMLLVLLKSPDAVIARSREVFILNPDVVKHSEGVYHVNTISAMLLEQAHRTALLFHFYPDKGTQFALQLPFLDPFTATLFTLGLGYALCHWRSLGSWLLLSWIALGLVIGSFLTVNPPFWPRLMILLPPCALLSAISLNLLYELLDRNFISIKSNFAPAALSTILFLLIGFVLTIDTPFWLRLLVLLPPGVLLVVIAFNLFFKLLHRNFISLNDRLTLAASLAVILFLIVLGWQNWNLYVEKKGSYATARTFIGRYLAVQPPATKAYLVSSFFNYNDREFEFLAPGRLVDNLTPEQVEGGTLPLNSTKMLIFSAEEQIAVERLLELNRGAEVETYLGNSPDEVAFYVVRLP